MLSWWMRKSPIAPRTTILDLPVELISIVVKWMQASTTLNDDNEDWEQDVRSLCLAHSKFVRPCQEAVFENVEVGPGLTARFDELIKAHSHLAKHVHSLHYRLPDVRIRDETEAWLALQQLRQVRSLHVQYGGSSDGITRALDWGTELITFAGTWQYQKLLNAFAEILSRPILKTLILTNIRIPAAMVSEATELETLHLHGLAQCGLFIRRIPETRLQIHNLTLTGGSTHEFGRSFHVAGGPHPIAFSQVKVLQMDFGRCGHEDKAKEVILGEATNLSELTLKTPDSGSFKASFNRNVDPIRHLHANAFTSLTHLLIDIAFNITSPSDVIRDPFQGLVCSDQSREATLGNLKGLQSLKVRIWIRGPAWKKINLEANFASAAWQDLDNFLVPPGSLRPNPQLEYVELIAGVEGDCDSAPQDDVEPFLLQIERYAHSLPWMGRIRKVANMGEIEGAVAAWARHSNCPDPECPYFGGL